MPFLAGKARLIIATAGVIVAAVYASAATQLRIPAFSDPVGPRMVPYLIALGLVLSCAALVIEHLVMARRKGDAAASGEVEVTRIALLTIGLLVGYYLLFDVLGFILATVLFLMALLSITNRGRWLVNIAVAGLFPIAAYFLLATLLGARLPAGLLQLG